MYFKVKCDESLKSAGFEGNFMSSEVLVFQSWSIFFFSITFIFNIFMKLFYNYFNPLRADPPPEYNDIFAFPPIFVKVALAL